uniref:Disease resistance R13L4/SHOC-2-like LRR domain-containing protein n=1 Tax=Oryza meridionalis TaxID=40149 RepID=A0A0E0CLS6_9ORYZ
MDAPSGATDTANAAGGDATLAVPPPPPLLTGTAVPPPPPAAAQPQPQQATVAEGDPPPPATGGAEEVAGKPPQPPATDPASEPTAPPEPPRATEEKKGDDEPPPPPPASTGVKEEVAGHGQPPLPTSTPASKPPAPPEPTRQQQQAGDAAKQAAPSADDEDGGKKRHSRWNFLRNLFRRHKGSLRDAVKAAAVTKPRKEEEEEEKSKKTAGPDEASKLPPPPPLPEAAAPPPAPDDDAASRSRSTRRRLVKVLRAVQFITRLKNWRNRPPEDGKAKEKQKPSPETKGEKLAEPELGEANDKPPAAQQEEEEKKKKKDQEETPEAKAQRLEEEKEEKSRRRWKERGEALLQKILEAAFEALLAGEFNKLKDQWRQCLLTFSFFPVNHKVKKQAVTYWWAAQFGLPHRRAPGVAAEAEPRGSEEIFAELCGSGFLEPITSRCSGSSHGCRVNPLVHWMVKRTAREGFAALDQRGDPADDPGKSKVLCLMASHRERLQRLGRADESPVAPAPSPTRKLSKGKTPSQHDRQQKEAKEDRQQKEQNPTGTPSKMDVSKLEGETMQKKPNPTGTSSEMAVSKVEGETKEQQNENDKSNLKIELRKFENILVILNINAHVYRLPDCLLSYLGDRLVVLQLGRWWNSDNSTYMEVEGLEKLNAIGNLKKLRYLGIRGLSKLTELPENVNKLQQLEVLDVRGCQNLTCLMSSTVRNLRQLTHLDLTECYMLEYIGREITSLSELQVFKGFVFGFDTPRRYVFRCQDRHACRVFKDFGIGLDTPRRCVFHYQDRYACRLQDLKAMKNLRKLSINVTTDANVDKNDMGQLKHLESLQSLTITWGELPSILTSAQRLKEKKQLLKRWTSLVLPSSLVKLDVRCYPSEEIPYEWFEPKGGIKPTNLKKLYVRGGAVKRLNLPRDNHIETLRLRYLKEFKMKWEEILEMMNNLHYVEVVYKDPKVMKSKNIKHQTDNVELQPHMIKEMGKKAKEEEEKCMAKIKNNMGIPDSTLDEHGVWEKDQKEVDQKKAKKEEEKMIKEKEKKAKEEEEKMIREKEKKAKEEEEKMIKEKEKKAKEEEEKYMAETKKNMGILDSTLNEHRVWEKDQKEVDQNKKGKGFEGDGDGSKDAPESTNSPSKVQNDHDSEATINNNVTKVSSESDLMGKEGAQGHSGQQPNNDSLRTEAITNQDVDIPKESHNVENAQQKEKTSRWS